MASTMAGSGVDVQRHELGGVLGDIGIGGEHDGDRLADIAHAVLRQHVLPVGFEAPRPWSAENRSAAAASTSLKVHTANTPGSASASAASTEFRMPCAAGERTTRIVQLVRETRCREANRPCPVSSGRSSSRATELPIGPPGIIRSAHLGGRGADRLDDVLVAGAAAEVRRQDVEQFLVADVRLPLQHADRQHQEARRAEAALQAVVLHEGALHRMQLVAVGSPSTVRIGLPSACTANIRQERTGSPSTITVQAPQTPCSQPMCVPVCPQSSRIASASVRRGSTAIAWSRPLMLSVMGALGVMRAFLPSARSAARMRCGVAGISSIDTPNGESASLMALITAAGAPMAPPSPSPLALEMVAARQGLEVVQLDHRDFVRGRRQVVGERRRQDVAVLVVDDLLEQRVADALRDAAVHLAVGDHRVDQAAGVLGDEEALDRHLAGLHVDLDDGHMARIGEGAGRIVVAVFASCRARSRP